MVLHPSFRRTAPGYIYLINRKVTPSSPDKISLMLIYIQKVSLILFQHWSQRSYLLPWGWRNHSHFLIATPLEHGVMILIASPTPRWNLASRSHACICFCMASVRSIFSLPDETLPGLPMINAISALYVVWNLDCQNSFLIATLSLGCQCSGWLDCLMWPTPG